jgi:hypothetical protein
MAALCCVVAGTWAWLGEPERRSTVAFGAALAGSITAGFLLTAPASAWTGGYCDAISVDLLVPVTGGAVILALAAVTLSQAGPDLRLGVLGLAGGSLLAASLAALPACLANPLDRLDPLLVTHWLDHVSEARSILEAAQLKLGGAIASVYLASALSVLACLYLIRVGPRRAEWSMLLVIIAIVAAFAAYQIRYVLFLTFLSVPVWASLVSQLRWRSNHGGGLRFASATVAAVLLALAPGLAMTLPFTLPWRAEEERSPAMKEWARQAELFPRCATESSFERIALLPPGRVASTSNMGAYILLWSPHEAISAPYHRNQAGMLGQLGVALAETPEEAERGLKDMGVDYLLLCRSDYELHFVRNGADGQEPLLLRLVRGDVALEGFPLLMREGGLHVFGTVSDRDQG